MDRLLTKIKALKEKGFFHLIISNYSIQVIVFISHLLIAKIMDPTYVGMIKTIEVYITIAVVLGSGGMIFAILKIVPQYKDKETRDHILHFSLKYILVFSSILFVVINLISYTGIISDDATLLRWFRWYSFIIIPSVFLKFLIRYFQAINAFKKISLLVIYFKIVSAIIVLSLTYFFYLRGYIISMVLTTIITVSYLLYDIKKDTLPKIKETDSYKSLSRKLITLSKPAFIATLIDQLKLQIGFLLANYIVLDRYMFGQYSFALILIQGLSIILISVQQFIIPKLSKISNNTNFFFIKLKVFEKQLISVSFIIFVLAQLILPIIINSVFANKYDEAIPLLRILLVGWFISSFYALKGVSFLSLGKMKYISIISGLMLLIVFPVTYYLNIKYDVYGSAYAYVFQVIVNLFLLTFFTNKFLKTNNAI